MKHPTHNRREFIKKSGLWGGALLLEKAWVFEDFKSSQSLIRVGVVGLGSRGKGLIRRIQEIPGFKLVAGCDVLPERIEECKLITGPEPAYFADYSIMLREADFDAIVIATPLFTHFEIINSALTSELHIYCEKTMTYDHGQADHIVDRLESKQDIVFQVGYQYRYSKLYEVVAKMVQNGSIGQLVGIRGQWNRNGDWRRPVINPAFEKLINWRMYKDYSRGLLGELTSHQIDFVNWITGATPLSVIGYGGIDYWKDGRETEDNIQVVFEYPNGLKVSLGCQTANAYQGYQMVFLGDTANIIVGQNQAVIFPEEKFLEYGTVDGVTGATITTSDFKEGIPINIPAEEPTANALQHFLKCILEKKQPPSNAHSGRDCVYAVEIATRAIEEKRMVFWNELN
ncbi:MAG TPA: Gfo/Idh/MocA family oxidoreductase [Membranihabitans sp.]|nr:Gfo/Idh/MocA family oxidoreductase [Membranihabitans sp.]